MAGSEHKAHGKMASLFTQPTLNYPAKLQYGNIPSKKEILTAQPSAVQDIVRSQHGKECSAARTNVVVIVMSTMTVV
jgi:hypothetical protein